MWSSEALEHEEGCLFIPEYYAVERPHPEPPARSIAKGSCAKCWPRACCATVLQHEIDHLNGVLFIDHISKLKRDRVIKKFQKAAQETLGMCSEPTFAAWNRPVRRLG